MSLEGGAARLPITIELGAGWDGDSRRVAAPTFERLKPELRKLLDALGLPGKPMLRVTAGDARRAVRLRVHGILQPYPPELLTRAWNVSAPPGLADLSASRDRSGLPGFPDAWLRAYLGAGPSDSDLGHFLAEVTLDVVTAHPSCLIGPAQVAGFAGDWQQGADAAQPLPNEELELLLLRLVELGVSVLDRAALGQVVGECRRWGQPLEDTVEAAFARLRPRQLTVLLHPVDLQELITGYSMTGPVSGHDQAVEMSAQSDLRKLQESVYFELGLRLPELILASSSAVPQGTVAVNINHLPGRPLRSRPRDIARVIRAEVLRSASRLLSVEEVEYELYELQKAFPELVEAALMLISLGDLTRVLRGLLAERVSVHDLRALLERLVQYGMVPADPTRYVVLDQRIPQVETTGLSAADRWRSLLAFARAGSGLRNYPQL
jgi:FHIPEP family